MKPTSVVIKKTGHKDQPYTVTIHPPGKKEPYTIKQRYSRTSTAKLGATRHLGGYVHREYDYVSCKYRVIGYKMQDGTPIVFK